MSRCVLLLLLAGIATAWQCRVGAQQPGKSYRLGVLSVNDPFRRSDTPLPGILPTVVLPELANRGFAEGRNLAVDARFGVPDALPDLADELVA